MRAMNQTPGEIMNKEKCILIITHYKRILEYIKPDKIFIMKSGEIIKEGSSELVEELEKKGLIFSGYHLREDGTKLMEYIELPKNSFFVGTQSHPEFKSRLGNPSPLFYGFVKACMK